MTDGGQVIRSRIAQVKVLLEILFSILNVVATDDLKISMVLILFVVQKVYLFQESPFMMFQLSH